MISTGAVHIVKCRLFICHKGWKQNISFPVLWGGRDTVSNLCPACPNCNAHKAKKISAIAPQSLDEVILFNPRKQKWIEHFNWDESGIRVIGRTNIGRATVAALKMNLADIVAWRNIIVGIGGYPPKLD